MIARILPRVLLGCFILSVALWLALNRDSLDAALIERTLRDLGPWAPVIHALLFALGAVLFVPGAALGLAGGALFGPVVGTLVNLVGATLGATAAFLIARYLAQDRVRVLAGPRLARLIAGIEAEGWKFVALVRLMPLFPFSLMNYALGLTRIRLAPYVLVSSICMLPGTLAYTWLGYAGKQAFGGDTAAIQYGLLGLGLLAAIAFVPRLVRRFRASLDAPRWISPEELAAVLQQNDTLAVVDVRGPDEFLGPLGHIKQARNVPVDELTQRIAELAPLASKSVVLVCHTDRRSARAAAILQDANFRDVRVLRGGMVRWTEGGLPVKVTD